ncbi:MAG: DUF2914 domain-containing protein [Proteobacteria bacterium]|nr:DUF2914 domain-containing protein [Pseudomonadota bacterium]
MNAALDGMRSVWTRSQRIRTPAFFLAGVTWDYATLQLESAIDQVLIAVYLVGVLILVVATERHDRKRWLPEIAIRAAKALPLATQFLLGALLSALAISVWRAAHPGPASLFVALLAGLAVANEARSDSGRGTASRFALAGFLSYQVLALLIPLATGTLWSPLPALVGTAGLVGATIWASRVHVEGREPPPTIHQRTQDLVIPTIASSGAVLALLVSTWLGLVPPLPLVLKRAAVATDVERTADGPELADPIWTDSLMRLVLGRPTVRWAPGEKVLVYTAVHAPTGMDLELIHEWEHYDPSAGGWVSTDRIPLTVRGGREGGWRTWSTKTRLSEGDWRVRVQTPYGQELGRVPFIVDKLVP